ncbi:hypothetical protein VPH35_045494 [Triticum aestivum]
MPNARLSRVTDPQFARDGELAQLSSRSSSMHAWIDALMFTAFWFGFRLCLYDDEMMFVRLNSVWCSRRELYDDDRWLDAVLLLAAVAHCKMQFGVILDSVEAITRLYASRFFDDYRVCLLHDC